MRIGGAKEYEQETSLHDYINNMGQGMLGIPDKDHIPNDMLQFVITQFQRFAIPYNKDIEDVLRVGCYAMIWIFDYIDPYLFLADTSDVGITSDWSKHQYVINNGDTSFYAETENLETFAFKENQDLVNFNHHMANPGIEQLPHGISEHLEMILEGDYGGDYLEMILEGDYGGDYLDQLTNGKAEEALKDLCRNEDGTINFKKFKGYFHLSSWAAYCWMIGPYGREWRYTFHDIFYECRKYGEALVYEGGLIGKEYYTKLPRAPQSCSICNLDAWCVEVSQISGRTEYACEKCLNGAVPLYNGATCGTKACRFAECPNHPNHGQLHGTYLAHKEAGRLTSMVRQDRLSITGNSGVKLISN